MKCVEEADKWGLTVSLKKTEMVWEWVQALGMLLLCRWCSGEIEMVGNSAYLCSILSKDGYQYVMKGTRGRIAKASVPFG